MYSYWGYNPYYVVQPCQLNDSMIHDKMRQLWSEHVAWIRMTVVSLVLDLPDAPFVVNRLLRTATDMGNAIKPFYGEQIGDTYTQLLTEHISLAGDLIQASKAGDVEKAQEIETAWYKNGDKISVFLNEINPYIPLQIFKGLFYEHLNMSKQQAVTMLEGNYEENVNLFDPMLTEGLQIADLISAGIYKQFHF